MSWFTRIFSRRRLYSDLSQEIQEHLEEKVDELMAGGMSREEAYRLVQGHAMRAWQEGLDFRKLITSDKEITSRVPQQEVEHAFDLDRQLRNVDKIFARVFKEAPAGTRGKTPARKRS